MKNDKIFQSCFLNMSATVLSNLKYPHLHSFFDCSLHLSTKIINRGCRFQYYSHPNIPQMWLKIVFVGEGCIHHGIFTENRSTLPGIPYNILKAGMGLNQIRQPVLPLVQRWQYQWRCWQSCFRMWRTCTGSGHMTTGWGPSQWSPWQSPHLSEQVHRCPWLPEWPAKPRETKTSMKITAAVEDSLMSTNQNK